MKYTYNLNIKKILIHLLLTTPLIFFMFFMIFKANNEDKEQLAKKELVYSIKYNAPIGSVYIAGIYCLIVDIYFLELLIYKRKNVLNITENEIIFFAPEYGKIIFYKNDVKNIILNNNYLKIIIKSNIKKGIRAKIWSFLKSFIHGFNPKNTFIINLKYINCYEKDLRYLLVKYKYFPNSQKANYIINDIMQENNIKSINELKQNKEIFELCILKLYELDNFSQANIAAILQTNPTKVSKTIRQIINKNDSI